MSVLRRESEESDFPDRHISAILVSDIHLRQSCPIARAEKGEDEWSNMQSMYLSALYAAWKREQVPILIAGDIFHKWHSPPSVISQAIKYFSQMEVYAIPGNHDLPLWNYGDRKKSAYWTLVQSKAIKDVPPGEPFIVPNRYGGKNLVLQTFPWGTPLRPNPSNKESNSLYIAMAHVYCWSDLTNSYKDAPKDGQVTKIREQLKNYDIIHLGDNHVPFRNGNIINPGCMIPQKKDEKGFGYSYFVYSDGVASRCAFAILDQWEEDIMKALNDVDENDVEGLLDMLVEMGDVAFDFVDILRRRIDKLKVGKDVRQIILRALEGTC